MFIKKTNEKNYDILTYLIYKEAGLPYYLRKNLNGDQIIFEEAIKLN